MNRFALFRRLRGFLGWALSLSSFGLSATTQMLATPAAPWRQLPGPVEKLAQQTIGAKRAAVAPKNKGLQLSLDEDSEPLPRGSRFVIQPLVDGEQGDEGLQPGLYQLDVMRDDSSLFRGFFLAMHEPVTLLRLHYAAERFRFRQELPWPQPEFVKGQGKLLPRSDTQLRQLAALLKRQPDIQRLRIAVHTDTGGLEARNQELTEQRAQTVAERLKTMGVDSKRLLPEGLGSREARYPQGTREQRRLDRRVEFGIEVAAPVERQAVLEEKAP